MVQTVFHMDGDIRVNHCQFHTRANKYLEFATVRDFDCVTRFMDPIIRANSDSIVYRSEIGKTAKVIRTGTSIKN